MITSAGVVASNAWQSSDETARSATVGIGMSFSTPLDDAVQRTVMRRHDAIGQWIDATCWR